MVQLTWTSTTLEGSRQVQPKSHDRPHKSLDDSSFEVPFNYKHRSENWSEWFTQHVGQLQCTSHPVILWSMSLSLKKVQDWCMAWDYWQRCCLILSVLVVIGYSNSLQLSLSSLSQGVWRRSLNFSAVWQTLEMALQILAGSHLK